MPDERDELEQAWQALTDREQLLNQTVARRSAEIDARARRFEEIGADLDARRQLIEDAEEDLVEREERLRLVEAELQDRRPEVERGEAERGPGRQRAGEPAAASRSARRTRPSSRTGRAICARRSNSWRVSTPESARSTPVHAS